MMNTPDDLRAHLMETSEEFRQLAQQHSEYNHQLEELEARPHLTEPERLEEVQLKKLKLRLKDQMEVILSRSRAQVV